MHRSRGCLAPVLAVSPALFLCHMLLAQGTSLRDAQRQTFLHKLSDAALERTRHCVRYDSAYVRIPYPCGDVPADTGVCSYRALGIDLQKEVHEDMKANLASYPSFASGRPSPTDTNIDHRRVPNLMVFFSRNGERLPITKNAEDYRPGDLITWDLGGGVPQSVSS